MLAAVKGRSFSKAAFPWLKMLAPGEAYAVHVGGQPTLKVSCPDEEGVAALLGNAGAKL